ncbi:MAG: hypothetical protein AAF399_09140 [Bacteroidota bacterium]
MKQALYIHARCPECGSQLVYDGGGKKKLKCTSCRYSRELGRQSDQVVPRKLHEGVKLKEFKQGLQWPLKSHMCLSCGGEVAVDADRPWSSCPYCGSEELEETKRHEEVLLPYSIIPFSISQSLALRKLRRWLGRGRFLPNDIFGLKKPERLLGIYLPFFLFDALTRSTWMGEVGIAYFPDPKKKKKRMAWEPTAGYYEHFFQDLPLGMSEAIQDQYFEEIGEYNFRKLVPYDPKYLKTFATELYSLPEIEAFKLADMLMSDEIQIEIFGRLTGDDARKFRVNSEKHSVAFRHVLVPVWLGQYTHKGRLFQVMINGQSGEIAGDKPIDLRKAIITVAAIVAVALLLVLLVWL